MNSKNEIIFYNSNELPSKIEVRIEDETVWLNRQQIASLFGRDVKTIGKHINKIFIEGELVKEVVVAKFATTSQHGAIKGKVQTLIVEYFNLDVIISVGYRVKSKQGTQFRIWANKVLKDHLLRGYSLNKRMNRIEDNFQVLSEKVNEIDVQIKSSLPPNQGIFFNGQIFDAYLFISDLIRSARKSIVLIDNYIDESVLRIFTKRNKDVSVKIYTKYISKILSQDIAKHNAQYPPIDIQEFTKAHDRFIIIDDKELYHIGASLKDLGKKWFAFSKMKLDVVGLVSKISQ